MENSKESDVKINIKSVKSPPPTLCLLQDLLSLSFTHTYTQVIKIHSCKKAICLCLRLLICSPAVLCCGCVAVIFQAEMEEIKRCGSQHGCRTYYYCFIATG